MVLWRTMESSLNEELESNGHQLKNCDKILMIATQYPS